MVGGAQLPCEAFVIAIVAEDPLLGGESAWASQLLLVADGYVVKAKTDTTELELRAFGAEVAELAAGRRSELSFRSQSGHLYLSLARRARGEVGVAGHIVRDASGLLSAFQSRTDLASIESFGESLRAFPHG